MIHKYQLFSLLDKSEQLKILKQVGFTKVKKGQALKVDLESAVFIVAKGTLIHFIDEATSFSYTSGSLVVAPHLYPVE